MRAFITGIGGFVGQHLAGFLIDQGAEVSGCDVRTPRSAGARIRFFKASVTSASAIRRVLAQARPDVVFHLAGLTFVPECVKNPRRAWRVNLDGTVNLCEAVRTLAKTPRVVFVGTADEYGIVAGRKKITEGATLNPRNAYAASKAAADLASYDYYLNYQCPIIRVRPFNHTGPGQSRKFVASAFARQISRIEKGTQPPVIKVGDLRPVRDITDVRDIVKAYWLAATKGVPGEVYNVCSGKGISMADLLDALLEESGCEVEICTERGRLRRLDDPYRVGDARRFRRLTGWRPTIALGRTLRDLLQYWRER